MPRRRAVTREQLEELLVLPVAEPELIRHWTLDAADLAAIERRRGDPKQLGFALQLCAFRYPGRLLRSREAIPEAALAFVAGQLRVAPDALADYAARHQTRRAQLRALPSRAGQGAGCCLDDQGRHVVERAGLGASASRRWERQWAWPS
jgi:TnpA family transposase